MNQNRNGSVSNNNGNELTSSSSGPAQQQMAAYSANIMFQSCRPGLANFMPFMPTPNMPRPASTMLPIPPVYPSRMPTLYPTAAFPYTMPCMFPTINFNGCTIIYNGGSYAMAPPAATGMPMQAVDRVMHSSTSPPTLLQPGASTSIYAAQKAMSRSLSISQLQNNAETLYAKWEDTDIVITNIPPLDTETKNVKTADIKRVVLPQLNGPKKYEWTGYTCSGHWKYERSGLYDEHRKDRFVMLVCSCGQPQSRQSMADVPQIRILWNASSRKWILQRHRKRDGTFGHVNLSTSTPYFVPSKKSYQTLQLLCMPQILCDCVMHDILPELESSLKRPKYVIKRLKTYATDQQKDNPSFFKAFEVASKNMANFSSDVRTIIKHHPTGASYKTVFANDDIKELIDVTSETQAILSRLLQACVAYLRAVWTETKEKVPCDAAGKIIYDFKHKTFDDLRRTLNFTPEQLNTLYLDKTMDEVCIVHEATSLPEGGGALDFTQYTDMMELLEFLRDAMPNKLRRTAKHGGSNYEVFDGAKLWEVLMSGRMSENCKAILNKKNKYTGKRKRVSQQCEKFDKLLKEEIVKLARGKAQKNLEVKYTTACFKSVKHTLQSAHYDYNDTELKNKDKLHIAFLPITAHGSFLQVWPKGSKVGRLLYFPYGQLVVLPPDTLHAGGMRTDPEGQNARLHFAIQEYTVNDGWRRSPRDRLRPAPEPYLQSSIFTDDVDNARCLLRAHLFV